MPDDDVVCRFAVGSRGGPRSPSFRVWIARNHPDFYVSMRSIASVFKATIHAPRPELELDQEGHAGTDAQFFRKARASGIANGTSRFGAKWRGREVSPGTWLQLQILVPSYGLRLFEERASSPMKWIAAPPDDQMVLVNVFTVAGHLRWNPSPTVLGSAELCDGRRVVVTGYYWSAPPIEEFASMLRDEFERAAIPVPVDSLRQSSMRIVLVGTGQDNGLLVDLPADLLVSWGGARG